MAEEPTSSAIALDQRTGRNVKAPPRLVLRHPDDFHVHLRDGMMLKPLVNVTARQFARAIVMPNLDPPVATTAAAEAYRSRILAALDPAHDFTPLMTLYLTDNTKPSDVEAGFKDGVLTAAKLYPARATTNSALGVTDLRNLYGVFAAMERLKMPLLVHGEVADPNVDIFDREKAFLDRYLTRLVHAFPALKIVLEHISTEEAACLPRVPISPQQSRRITFRLTATRCS